MKISNENNTIRISEIENFKLEHIFKCGQAFRWEQTSTGFINVAKNKVIELLEDDKDILIKNTSLQDFNDIWYEYFDLSRNYKKLIEELSIDETLKNALSFGNGIRILNQEPFETIITFIISANNQIPRIKKSVEIISKMYGKKIENYNAKDYFSFPTPEELSKATPTDLREYAKVGFRDERIVETSKMIFQKEIDLDKLYTLEIEKAREELMKLKGVGPKVCDCILLFVFKRSESFPVDVWIKRVMEELYFKKVVPKNKIAEEGRKIFGQNAGFAQQYLFFYGRENKLGRE